MKDVIQIIVVCIAVLYTYDFFKELVTGKKNLSAVAEWIGRGYCFGLGLLIVFVLFILLIKAFSK